MSCWSLVDWLARFIYSGDGCTHGGITRPLPGRTGALKELEVEAEGEEDAPPAKQQGHAQGTPRGMQGVSKGRSRGPGREAGQGLGQEMQALASA